MYAQNHATTQHLMNGASHQRFGMQINMAKPFQHQTHQHHGQHHAQHQEAGNHASHAGNFTHHQHTHSGGGLPNAGAHYSGHLQNGTLNASYNTTAKPPSDHWAQQLQLASQEREWQVAHPRARNAQGLSKMSLVSTASMLSMGDENQERQRPITDDTASKPKDQTWMELDMGGNTLRVMAPSLFEYTFLTKLYFNNNKLSYLPTEIGKLRNIKTLDLSINELRELPPQIGMLVNLKELLLFDNQLETLPFEVGNLYQCAMLGVEGNPLNDEYKSIVMEHGSIELIKFLRESAPGKSAHLRFDEFSIY
jgi:CCR4-NOT transcription complex subunit 6